MNIFDAGVQYDDYKGTVAADRADNKSFLEYLKQNGVAKDDELLVGWRFGFGGNDGQKVAISNIVVYLHEGVGYVEKPQHVRAVEIDLPLAELFSFFKRFDLVMTKSDVGLDEDTAVDGPHYD